MIFFLYSKKLSCTYKTALHSYVVSPDFSPACSKSQIWFVISVTQLLLISLWMLVVMK